MRDNKPSAPIRTELARVFKDQRTLRAFEQLFAIIPDELEDVTDVAELVFAAIGESRAANKRAEQRIERLEAELFSMRSMQNRQPDNQDALFPASNKPNTDTLLKRIEFLESLVGAS